MIAELGAFSLILALVLSIAQTALAAAGRITGSEPLRRAAEGAAAAVFLAVAAAFAALTAGFVTSDFSILYVAANSHTDKPLIYKIAGVWGGHEGSLLLWCLALTGYGAAVALTGERLPRGLKGLTLMSQGALGLLFIGFAVFASNPFLRLAAPPVEGRSLNPLLQDPALAIHPPFLYAGYVGLSIPFSLAIAALIEGRVDAAWARWVRPWALAAWSLLTVGITLGSFWAYYELGWGGWWFWDPVENASFMPWLAATALLHSAIVTEKRGALAGWTVFLALMAFSFSMLGAFLVRSGVLTSVHAFAVDPQRGAVLLVILGVAAGAGFALFAWRAPRFAPGGVFAPISREASLVLNNLFLATVAVAVLLGTLYPLIVEAITGKTISVGPAYYGVVFVPIMAVALLILPVGPLLSWKRADLGGVLQRLAAACGIGVACALGAYLLSQPKQLLSALGVGLGAWVVAGALSEVVERGRIGRSSFIETWRRLAALPTGAWGMTLAHVGLGLFVMGASYETAWKLEAADVLAPGGHLRIGEYRLTLDRLDAVQGPNFTADRTVLRVTRHGQPVCDAEPERRFYPANRQSTAKIALCFEGLSDLYVVAGDTRPAANGQPGQLIRAYWNPWVRFIFLGPLLMALGGLISLADRRLRLAVGRRSAAAVPQGAGA
ncbi:MAG TPA: heme lyase CcmF/NrfE family subunit [Caulobacteraceae bacterium]|jgi:cytochrome c-type biogenesis protein CcmF|nr:heme lyase CcmF/NrfE family subunit [Caulobacteraceae bacterium]